MREGGRTVGGERPGGGEEQLDTVVLEDMAGQPCQTPAAGQQGDRQGIRQMQGGQIKSNGHKWSACILCFARLLTSQSITQHKSTFIHSHTHSHTNRRQLGVQCLVQGHFDVRT